MQVVVLAVVDLMFYMPELIFAMDYKVGRRAHAHGPHSRQGLW
jgi:hypothetical protein